MRRRSVCNKLFPYCGNKFLFLACKPEGLIVLRVSLGMGITPVVRKSGLGIDSPISA